MYLILVEFFWCMHYLIINSRFGSKLLAARLPRTRIIKSLTPISAVKHYLSINSRFSSIIYM